jgi:hypothetical protein
VSYTALPSRHRSLRPTPLLKEMEAARGYTTLFGLSHWCKVKSKPGPTFAFHARKIILHRQIYTYWVNVRRGSIGFYMQILVQTE